MWTEIETQTGGRTCYFEVFKKKRNLGVMSNCRHDVRNLLRHSFLVLVTDSLYTDLNCEIEILRLQDKWYANFIKDSFCILNKNKSTYKKENMM